MKPENFDKIHLWQQVAGCRNQKWSYTGAVVLAQEGNESRENMTRPQLLMARLMQPIPMMFITTPVLACRGRIGGGEGGYYDDMRGSEKSFYLPAS